MGTESNNGFLGNVQAGKTFCNNVVKGFNRADYESLSEEDAMAPRGIDGSMPARFARLGKESECSWLSVCRGSECRWMYRLRLVRNSMSRWMYHRV